MGADQIRRVFIVVHQQDALAASRIRHLGHRARSAHVHPFGVFI
jgi:hypothetical protein